MKALGIENHVTFLDQFVDQSTLLDFISMCDVYVTPYLNEEQMTSGTLAYSYGLGKAVVSTPYWHAKELLADGRGILVPFGDSRAIGKEISALLVNDVRRHAMRKRAYAASRCDDLATSGQSVLGDLRARPSAYEHKPHGTKQSPRLGNGSCDCFRRCGPNISFRCATAPDFCSMLCMAFPTAHTATASTTTHARCFVASTALTELERHDCPKR